MVTLLRDHVAVTGQTPFDAGGTATLLRGRVPR
jgi:hypothetical protein